MEKDLVDQLQKFKITCPQCNEKNSLERWGFVQTYWYKQPRGCNEGDYWLDDKDIRVCLVVCPNTCNDNNTTRLATRIMDIMLKAKEDREALEWTFTLISNETRLHEGQLRRIFGGGYYSQHGQDEEIVDVDEARRKQESALEF